jgi:TolB-like protein
MAGQAVQIGDLTLEPGLHLCRDGNPLPIGNRALQLLSTLASANGGVVSKDRLVDEVWNGAIVEENAIQAQVSALRKALGGEAGRLITIHRRGYRLDLSRRNGERASALERRSVAVMCFENRSGDPAHDYLAEGLAEELLAILSRLPELEVPARSSSFAYRGRSADARTIGSELGVATLVEGSLRVAAGRVRVSAELIDAATGFHLWSNHFESELTDLFAVQDEIAAAIATALQARLIDAGPRSRDLEAYQAYMQASMLSHRGSADDLIEAVSLYREAIARDPFFAPASARLARTLLGASNLGVLPLSARDEARERAEQAARSDPDLAIARMVVGGLDGLAGRWLAADESFAASLALDPRESDCHSMHGYYLLAPCGHLARAQAALDRAFELAPAVPLHSLGRATMATLRGDGQAIMRNLQMAERLGLSPDEPAIRAIRAELALLFGSWQEATEHVTVALPDELRAAGTETATVVHRACLGQVEKADASRAVAAFAAAADDELLTRHQIAFGTLLKWQIKLDALDAAYAIAGRMIAAWRRTGQLATTGLFPMWLPGSRAFRDDPRFQGFAAELGMFDYWRRHGPPDGHVLRNGRLEAGPRLSMDTPPGDT